VRRYNGLSRNVESALAQYRDREILVTPGPGLIGSSLAVRLAKPRLWNAGGAEALPGARDPSTGTLR
jgi:hypothetical protein